MSSCWRRASPRSAMVAVCSSRIRFGVGSSQMTACRAVSVVRSSSIFMGPALGLARVNHNWGLIVADSRRVLEFVEFYEAHPELEPAAKRLLGDLILASLNKALEEERLSRAGLECVARFFGDVREEQRENFEYWTSLTPTICDPHPVVAWLTAMMRDWAASEPQTGHGPVDSHEKGTP